MNERNNKLELLGSAPIPKALMALGIPIMIGMLINALYNLVDAYFVAGLGKSQMVLHLETASSLLASADGRKSLPAALQHR